MSTPSTIPAALREAKTTALGIFNRMPEFSVMLGTGIARQMPASEGFLKLANASIPGRMRRKTSPAGNSLLGNTAPQTGVVTAAHEVAGATFDKIIAIDNDLLKRTDAITQGEITRQIRAQASVVGGEIDMQLTELLEANGAWMSGAALFSSSNGPMTGAISTFDNLESSAGATGANQKTNYYKWLTYWGTLRNVSRYAMNNTSIRPRPLLMHPAAIAEGVDDAFDMPAPGAAISTNNLAGKVQPFLNPYLTDPADNWYIETQGESALLAMGIVRAPEVEVWQDYENDCWKLKILFGAAFAAWDATRGFMCT
jgi:hypothetical protein